MEFVTRLEGFQSNTTVKVKHRVVELVNWVVVWGWGVSGTLRGGAYFLRVNSDTVIQLARKCSVGEAHLSCDVLLSEVCSCFALLCRVFRHCAPELNVFSIHLQTLTSPANTQFFVLCSLLLICSYLFRRNLHLQGADTNVVKMYCRNM
jgi:hypothetical protein